jgi:hypothetical protein
LLDPKASAAAPPLHPSGMERTVWLHPFHVMAVS